MEPHRARRERVLGEAWHENLKAIIKTGPVDLLCLTGDLAFSGKPHEYGTLTNPGPFTVSEFLSRTLAGLGLERTPERLFVVPGNHDIDRDICKLDWAKLRDHSGKLSRDQTLGFSPWMCGEKPPLGFAPELRDSVLSRQSAYRAWVEQNLRRELLPHVEVAKDESLVGPPISGIASPAERTQPALR